MKWKIIGLTTSAVFGSTMFSNLASAESMKVQSGDTLWSISQKYNISISAIKEANRLTSDIIHVGQVLQIPTKAMSTTNESITTNSAKPTEMKPSTYTVVRGDSLWKIAKKFQMTVTELKAVNQLESDVIYPGQILKISKIENQSTEKNSTPSDRSKASNSQQTSTYTVKTGDSLWKIANAYNTTVTQLKALNQLSSDVIYPGQILKVSGQASKASTQPTQTTANQSNSTVINGKVLVMIQEAKKLIGTPYKWGGNTPAGFDCSGFIYYVMNKVTSISRLSTAGYWEMMKTVNDPAVGDFVFFETYKPGPSHLGIYLGNGAFIHAGSGGVTISDLSSSYWKERYLGAKRYFE
ncbi:LysM peptidoglycan-binding domain-containing protein [Bacillus alveayuensis]|uniref:C40 family peptidase n=1 Tax=Aeribacillus alveayuensis TaxID=279215 RepID=UPI0005D11061|nr:peptidoglycan endopeptidase [Bacillus alveayuensis]